MYVEALLLKAEDVRLTRAHWDAATTKTTVQTYDDNTVTLAGAGATVSSHTSSDGNITDLNQTMPIDILALELPDGAGPNPRLTKVEAFLNRRVNGGQPTFDGDFLCQLYRIDTAFTIYSQTIDYWVPVPVCDPVRVRAAEMSADSALVAFNFDGASGRPFAVEINENFTIKEPQYQRGAKAAVRVKPNLHIKNRMYVVAIYAVGGVNQTGNYAWARDSAQAQDKTSNGTLRHRIATDPGVNGLVAGSWKITDASNMTRASLTIAVYSASGSIQFTGAQKPTLAEGSVQGTVEFVVKARVPTGTTLIASARVNGGDSWVPVKDGQAPADVGLAVSLFYEMKADFTANAAADTSPVLEQLGIIDRAVTVLADAKTDLVRVEGFTESVDIMSGEVKMAEGHIYIQRLGRRDFRDVGTEMMATNNFKDIELRTYVAHENVPRDQWLFKNIYRVDNYKFTDTEADLLCVSLLEQLKGNYPAPAGSLFGYVLKAAVHPLGGGADFTRELSDGSETATTLVVSLAASATEVSYGISAQTPRTLPNLPNWPAGSFIIKTTFTVGNANLFLKVRVSRINAAGTVQESTAYTDEQQVTAATLVFTIANVSWAAGSATDLIRVDYSFRNNVGSVQTCTIEFGTTNTSIETPWTATLDNPPKVYSLQGIKTVYTDWRDTQVGLSSRYRGATPTDDGTKITNTIQGRDGKRVLEEIAFMAGGTVIASQGKIKWVPYLRNTGTVVAIFPFEEHASHDVDPGLTLRVPLFRVPFGYNNGIRPDDFQADLELRHAVALPKFGLSRIDNPTQKMDEELARWIPDIYTALLVGEPIVRALGLGQNVWQVAGNIKHPELEVGDIVAVETENFVMFDPVTSSQLRGILWGIGPVIATMDEEGSAFRVWIRDLADIWVLTPAIQRRAPFEIPVIEYTEFSVPATPGTAQVRLRVYPDTATMYWYYHSDNTSPPNRDSYLWNTYTGTIQLARDSVADKLLSFYATVGGFIGPLYTIKIHPDKTPEVLTLVGSQSGGGPNYTVLFTTTVDSDVRRLRWYIKKGSRPTVGGGVNDPLDETMMEKEVSIKVDGGGVKYDGTPMAGGFACTAVRNAATYTTAETAYALVVPIDNEGNTGPRVHATYTPVGTPNGKLTAFGASFSDTGASCVSNPATVQVTWTPDANVSDGSYDLKLYRNKNGDGPVLITTIASPVSTTSYNDDLDTWDKPSGGTPMTWVYSYELIKTGPITTDSGQATELLLSHADSTCTPF